MINITYLPANDPFHAIFRLFVLFPDANSKVCSSDSARILDFYVCFPFLITQFKPPKSLVRAHNVLKKSYLPNSYQVTPKAAILFNRMGSPHNAATGSLQSYGFLQTDLFQDGMVARTSKPMPDGIAAEVQKHRADHADLVDFLDELKTLSLFGPAGLRARSDLEEHRYDNV